MFHPTEEKILQDTDKTQAAIKNVDPYGIINNTSNIARRANRILQVAQTEADNSEEPHYVDRVNSSITVLTRSEMMMSSSYEA